MRYGKCLTSWFRINSKDITNWFHRELIRKDGNLLELTAIDSFNPIDDDSTICKMRFFYPVTQKDWDSVYPTESSVKDDKQDGSSYDLKYSRLKCLKTDIPKV